MIQFRIAFKTKYSISFKEGFKFCFDNTVSTFTAGKLVTISFSFFDLEKLKEKREADTSAKETLVSFKRDKNVLLIFLDS